MSNIHSIANYKEQQRLNEIVEANLQRKYKNYKGDITRFKNWCKTQFRAVSFDSGIGYLLMLVEEKQVKLSTFYRNSAALRFYFTQLKKWTLPEDYEERVKIIRNLYNTPDYLKKKITQAPTTALPKDEVLQMIREYKNENNPKDYRIYTICLVNLITANHVIT